MKNILKGIIKYAVALGLVAWLVLRGGFDFALLNRIFIPKVAVACLALMFVTFMLNNYRWALLMRSQGLQASSWQLFPLTFIGQFFNIAIPGGVGGDLVKGYYMARQNSQEKLKAALSVGMDRVVGLFGLLFVAVGATVIHYDSIRATPQLMAFAAMIALLMAGFLFFFAIAFSSRILRSSAIQRVLEVAPAGELILKVYTAIHAYRAKPVTLIWATGLSILSQFSTIGAFFMAGWAMELKIPFSAYLFCIPLNMIATAFPITPGGIGVGQAVLFFLFNWFLGSETPAGPNLASAMQLLSLPWIGLGAYYYLRLAPRKAPPYESAA